MTQTEFNHLLASVDALSPAQMRQLLRELEGRVVPTRRPARADAGQDAAEEAVAKRPKRAKTKASPPPKKPLTIEELHQRMMAEGLITQLPDTAADFDDPDDQPITFKGEPLSETIIRERR